MELIVDLMLPTQGHSSRCNQVDDEYKLLIASLSSCYSYTLSQQLSISHGASLDKCPFIQSKRSPQRLDNLAIGWLWGF